VLPSSSQREDTRGPRAAERCIDAARTRVVPAIRYAAAHKSSDRRRRDVVLARRSAIVLSSVPRVRRLWAFEPVDPRRGALARSLSVDELTAQCLLNRGVADESAAREYLRAGLASLLRPEDLPDAAPAVARVRRAIRDGETICVWGDYDVDGICGAAVMIRFLRLVGAKVVPFIPDRSGSGYGFHWPTMQTLAAGGVRLFISVDHGSAAVDAITNARAAGLDVVVVDHHEMSPTLPPAVAVVNPKRPDSAYGFPYLCGTGVAMKLAWAVAQDMSPGARVAEDMREFLLESLSFCVLGTVADVVPLVGENRVIVRYGLDVLAQSPRPGLAALIDVAKARPPLRASDVGFKFGPRLNAAGRMGSASLALELLLTDDRARAREIALRLDAENDRRRKIEREVAVEARDRVIAELGASPHGIALMSDRWHPGVIGIVAARLVDEFQVPVVIVGVQAGVGKGSARSVKGFELHTALAACGGHLVAHGGHAGAAGLTIDPPRFDAFRDDFIRYVERTLDVDARTPRIRVDAETTPDEVDVRVATNLERLEPFGEGNPAPVLALRGVNVVGRPRRMGATNEHVSFFVGKGGRALRCVAFRDAARIAPLLEGGGAVDVAFTPQKNEFRGASEAEGLVVDVRPSE
jgi:single-stranded-DNA-specific exonuclease